MASQGTDAWVFNTTKCNNDHQDSGAAAEPKETGSLVLQTCELDGLTLEERVRLWATGKVKRERNGESGKTSLAGRSSEERATKRGIKAKGKERKVGNMQE